VTISQGVTIEVNESLSILNGSLVIQQGAKLLLDARSNTTVGGDFNVNNGSLYSNISSLNVNGMMAVSNGTVFEMRFDYSMIVVGGVMSANDGFLTLNNSTFSQHGSNAYIKNLYLADSRLTCDGVNTQFTVNNLTMNNNNISQLRCVSAVGGSLIINNITLLSQVNQGYYLVATIAGCNINFSNTLVSIVNPNCRQNAQLQFYLIQVDSVNQNLLLYYNCSYSYFFDYSWIIGACILAVVVISMIMFIAIYAYIKKRKDKQKMEMLDLEFSDGDLEVDL